MHKFQNSSGSHTFHTKSNINLKKATLFDYSTEKFILPVGPLKFNTFMSKIASELRLASQDEYSIWLISKDENFTFGMAVNRLNEHLIEDVLSFNCVNKSESLVLQFITYVYIVCGACQDVQWIKSQ